MCTNKLDVSKIHLVLILYYIKIINIFENILTSSLKWILASQNNFYDFKYISNIGSPTTM